jgi:hypothetical protein
MANEILLNGRVLGLYGMRRQLKRFEQRAYGFLLPHRADLKVSATAAARASSRGKSGSPSVGGPHSKAIRAGNIFRAIAGEGRG